MSKYKITLDNGKHPLTYECDTLEAVRECLYALTGWMPIIGKYDVDDIVAALMVTESGRVERQVSFTYAVEVGNVSNWDT